ncbi:uncharacterized protein LOC107465575 [Arachis duranensis]|uniref:Uncharacterized protein LOC107465575 n=1 Tax=Arachis duranensis TaxID=130453 RepID=A0A6P4BMH2_ARADU|nr:uncharacterized protein LOC107465575 [Arachis duranensis]
MTKARGEVSTFCETDERTLRRLRREARGKRIIGEADSEEENQEIEGNHPNLPDEVANNNGQPQRRVLAFYTFPNPRHLIERSTSSLPSDTIPNPKEECKAIQLRSGRTLVKDKEANKKPIDNDKTISKKDEASNKEEDKHDQEKLKEKDDQPQNSRKGKQVMEEASQGQKFNKEIKDQHFPKFFEVFKKLEINIPLAEALEQMPLYAKFLKELINKKRSWHEKETVLLTEECSAVIQRGIPPKLKNPGSFVVSCTIGKMTLEKALCDLDASINLMPLSMMRKLAIEEIKPTRMSLVMADRSIKTLNGVVKNLLVKVGEFIFPTDFVILDTKEEGNNSIILGRSFLSIARAIIDIEKGKMIFRVHNEQMVINVFKLMQHLPEQENYMRVDMIEGLVEEMLEANYQEQREEEREGVQEVMEKQVAEISIEEEVEQDKTEEMPK